MQADLVISDQLGATFLVEISNSLQALVTLSAGNTEPATTYPYQFWVDTSDTPNVLKQRNPADNAWIVKGPVGEDFETIYTSGLERLRIIDDGKVGIGTPTPDYALDVEGDINARGALRINGVEIGSVTDNSITFAKMQDVTANSVPVRAAGTAGDMSALQLPASRLLGRGSTGNIAAISLGDGLTMNGTVLSAGSGRLLGRTYFTASGTWSKSDRNPSFIEVEVVGGGGGGAGSTNGASGGGGGAGGYARKIILASDLDDTVAVTVGGGGSGGSGDRNGNTGGTSSFGTHCSATGGEGGKLRTDGRGGEGGVGKDGDFNLRGGGGGGGFNVSGDGGNSYFGGGGMGRGNSGGGGGNGAPNSGGGGGGGKPGSSGGPGGSGLVIVSEYA